MRFGVREICNVVFKARAKMTVGTKTFFKGEPVVKFDSLKTSTLEGAGTTVYAQGGRGNARLVAWDGERTVTFTMEDALISTESLAILTGAGVVEATSGKPVMQHITEVIKYDNGFKTSKAPSDKAPVYLIACDENGEFISEPYICKPAQTLEISNENGYTAELPTEGYAFVDYYVAINEKAYTMSIKADSFGGNFYIEADTLFREESSGQDMPAEFVIPNGRVQSNFNFAMAATGDPSTFTFTIDAFPAITRFGTEKVYCDINVIYGEVDTLDDEVRKATPFVK